MESKKPNKEDFQKTYYENTIDVCAFYFKVSKATIHNWRKSFDMELKNDMYFSDSFKEEFEKNYFSMSQKQVAEFYKVHRSTIQHWRAKFGIDHKHKENIQEKIPLPDKDIFDAVYHSCSRDETADHFKVSVATIQRWRRKFGIESKRFTYKSIQKEEFQQLYYSLSRSEVASHYGVSEKFLIFQMNRNLKKSMMLILQ